MSQLRVIKRYSNRKLYDTQRSRYVTLEQVAEMIRSGDEVQIVDNNTKEDLTSVTLAQIIFEEEKKQKSFLPLQAMRHLIQSGGESIQDLVAQAGGKVRSALRREPHEDGDGEAQTQGEERGAGATAEKERSDASGAVREFLEHSQRTFDEWQKRIDERIRHAIEAVSPVGALQKDIAAVAARLDELERRVRSVSADEGGAPKAP
jgi:polyhydroxyalkanoate synthesis repressor PhaR